MIGFSGFYNFSRSKKIKNFYESRFINNLDLSLSKVEGNNYYLSYVQNELDNKIFKKNGNYHLCIGDIYDSDFLKWFRIISWISIIFIDKRLISVKMRGFISSNLS